MVIQIWNEGDHKNGASVKIKLPIVTAPCNMFPAYAYSPAESSSVEVNLSLVKLGDNLSSLEPPTFLSHIMKVFNMPDLNDKELRPEGLETMVTTRDNQNYSVLRAIR